jgi:hypothetical protein
LTTISGYSNCGVSKFSWNKTPCNRIEVTVDTLYEQHEMSRRSNRDVYIGTRGSRATSLTRVIFDDDKESPLNHSVPR